MRLSRCAVCYLVMLQCYQRQPLSFQRALPACLMPYFLACDGSNTFMIKRTCQCNGGGMTQY